MRKYFLIAILSVLGVKFGWNYLLSEDFQKFGDVKKAPWTCQVNNTLGGFFRTASRYQRAIDLYDRVLVRCPETPMAEEAMFQKACALDDMTRIHDALEAFDLYRQTYPNGEHIKLATEAYDRLRFTR